MTCRSSISNSPRRNARRSRRYWAINATALRLGRPCRQHRLAPAEWFEPGGRLRVLRPPPERAEAEVQIAERAGERDAAEVDPIGQSGRARLELDQAARDLVEL